MKKLDLKGKKILHELDKNSRISTAGLGRKLKMKKEVVHYRINKLIKEDYIKKFYTIINTAKLGYVSYKIYFQFQNMTKEKEKEFINYLLNHKRVFWIAISSGTWELMLGSWAKDIIDFNKNVLQEILNKYSKFILNKAITITKRNIQWNRRWLYSVNKEQPITNDVGGEPESIKLDKIDIEVLRLLANNARLSIVEIAKRIKATPAVINYRIKQLIKKRVILSFRTAFDLHKFDYEFCKAFIYLQNITSEKEKRLIEYCKQNKNILNVVSCVGSWDLEIEFEVESFERFHEIMKEIKERFNDIIKHYESVLISKEPRVDFMPECYPSFLKKNL